MNALSIAARGFQDVVVLLGQQQTLDELLEFAASHTEISSSREAAAAGSEQDKENDEDTPQDGDDRGEGKDNEENEGNKNLPAEKEDDFAIAEATLHYLCSGIDRMFALLTDDSSDRYVCVYVCICVTLPFFLSLFLPSFITH